MSYFIEPPDNALITAEELRRVIGTSKATIDRWRRKGLLVPAIQTGATVRFRWKEVREALREGFRVIPNRPQPKRNATT